MIEHPENLKPGDRIVLTVTAVDPNLVNFKGSGSTYPDWLRDNADLLPEPAVDVALLRQVAVELRNMVTKGESWWLDDLRTYAATIESCLPPTEPAYTDPPLHQGMLVQAEDGTGPVWSYLPDGDEDTHPFYRLKTGPWYTRSELPERLRVVYIDADGQVRPAKEKP